jgi:hypothetical protein
MGKYKDPDYKKGYYKKNKKKITLENKKWAKEHPEKVKQAKKKWKLKNPDKVKAYGKSHPKKYDSAKERIMHIKRFYGITLEQYDKMFEEQGGVCAICDGINKDGRRLFIDHDHKTGKIRGLLCCNCNRGVGSFRDSVNNLQRAIIYLSKETR